MSFSSEIKEEISKNTLKSLCCRRSFLQGILAAKGRISDSGITFSLENGEYAKFASEIISEIYGKEPIISSPSKGGRCKLVSFNAPSAERYINSVLSGDSIFFTEKCGNCRSSFLKGIFFSSGRVSDPSKQYCLEFSTVNNEKLYDLLLENGLEFKISKRGTDTVIYSKNSSVIEDFFALTELHGATFAVMNAKISGEFKNNANRIRNFDTVNISKTVDSARYQNEIIQRLSKRGLLRSLPEELESTARLRLEYPELSMAQLALKSVPSISKSGLSHRMQRLIKAAKELLGEI